MKPLVILFFICSSAHASAQTDSVEYMSTPFSVKNSTNTFAVKGKILPWILGNNGGLNGTLGIEQGFLKRHSLGAEWFFHRWAEHHDNDSGYSDDAYHRNRALVMSYRFYYDGISKKRGLCFYNGVSYRYGRLKSEWSDALAENYNTRRIKYYNAVGFIFGMYAGCKNCSRFGIDINTGMFYTLKKIHDTYAPPAGIEYGNTTANTFDFRIGLNLIWWFLK